MKASCYKKKLCWTLGGSCAGTSGASGATCAGSSGAPGTAGASSGLGAPAGLGLIGPWLDLDLEAGRFPMLSGAGCWEDTEGQGQRGA